MSERAEEIQPGVCVMCVRIRGSDMIGEIQVYVLVIANKLCVSKPCFISIPLTPLLNETI